MNTWYTRPGTPTLCTPPWCTYPPPCVPTLHHHSGYPPATPAVHAARLLHAAKCGHQAQFVRMEILTEQDGLDSVTGRHIRPAPDTVTTFQNTKSTRVLIRRNTKTFPVFGSKGIIYAQERETGGNSGNKELHGNVYIRKPRSRAGSSGQTRLPDLVVLDMGSGILLSSVFMF